MMDVLVPAGQIGLFGIGQSAALAQRCGDVVIAVFLDEAQQSGAVELVRVHAFQRLGAASLPMLDQIAEELTGPADTAFEEGKTQFREAPGDAAEENRLGGRMPGCGEMADVAVAEIGRRQAQTLVEAGAVEGWCYA